MANWLRLILSTFALVGLLAAGTGGAFAAKPHHHHCCPQMKSSMVTNGHQCGEDERGTTPDCCLASLCAMTQPSMPSHAVVLAPRTFAEAILPARDDVLSSSLPISPNLRPPIA